MVKVTFSSMKQFYLIFQPLYYTVGLTDPGKITTWKSKGHQILC